VLLGISCTNTLAVGLLCLNLVTSLVTDSEADTESASPSVTKTYFFVAVSDSFGSYDIYLSGSGVQVTLCNIAVTGCCHRLIGSRRRREGWEQGIGVVGSGRRHAVDQLSARVLLPNVHGAHCVINTTDTKARFPAFSPRHCMMTYGDIVIEHIDFYGSIHTHRIVIRQQTQHAA